MYASVTSIKNELVFFVIKGLNQHVYVCVFVCAVLQLLMLTAVVY